MGAAVSESWVMCGLVARRALGDPVAACPRGGPLDEAACLTCRYLMTSSDERGGRSWCELPREAFSGEGSRPVRRPVEVQPDQLAAALQRVQLGPQPAMQELRVDHRAFAVGRDEAVRPALRRPRTALRLPRGKARAGAEEPRAPALR